MSMRVITSRAWRSIEPTAHKTSTTVGRESGSVAVRGRVCTRRSATAGAHVMVACGGGVTRTNSSGKAEARVGASFSKPGPMGRHRQRGLVQSCSNNFEVVALSIDRAGKAGVQAFFRRGRREGTCALGRGHDRGPEKGRRSRGFRDLAHRSGGPRNRTWGRTGELGRPGRHRIDQALSGAARFVKKNGLVAGTI